MRSFKVFINAIKKSYHWIGLFRSFFVYQNPIIILISYIFGVEITKKIVAVRYPSKTDIYLRESGDLVTVHEIFARNDYPVTGREKIILDIGANIGVSAKFFLLKCPHAKIISYEADPRNFEAWIKNNGNGVDDRIELRKLAIVPDEKSYVEFTQLESSRYGGIGIPGGKKINVPAISISKVLKDLISIYNEIDLLKLDIENMELDILRAIDPSIMKKIKAIYVELPYGVRYDIDGFKVSVQGQIHQYVRKFQA